MAPGKVTNEHEASASATGYLFQCRYALLLGLKAIADFPQLEISVERFDDIAFEQAGNPVELIQTKHHLAKQGSLSNGSVDLWKTLHIWTKLVSKDVDVTFRTRFTLLTTGISPEGSAASYIRVRDRNEANADALLMKTAHSSENKANADAYAAYREMPEGQRLDFLRAVTVLDGSSNIVDVHEDISRFVRLAVPKGHVEHFVERLEGWWFGIVIQSLASVGSKSISVLSIDNRIDELREEFRREALPVDFSDAEPSTDVAAHLDKRPFVRQLRQIRIGESRVEYAIRDFYRASEQRSKWAREDLLVDGELTRYERVLIEAWQPRHAAMTEDLPSGCDEDGKVSAGRMLYKWAETEAEFPLRTIRQRFLTHGSFHILSNQYLVGWHPDFNTEARDTAHSDEQEG